MQDLKDYIPKIHQIVDYNLVLDQKFGKAWALAQRCAGSSRHNVFLQVIVTS